MEIVIKVEKKSGESELSWFMDFLFLQLKSKEIKNKHAISIKTGTEKKNVIFKVLNSENINQNISLLNIKTDLKEFNLLEKEAFTNIFDKFFQDFIENQQYNIELEVEIIEKNH